MLLHLIFVFVYPAHDVVIVTVVLDVVLILGFLVIDIRICISSRNL